MNKTPEEQNRADYSSKVAAIRMSKGLSPLEDDLETGYFLDRFSTNMDDQLKFLI